MSSYLSLLIVMLIIVAGCLVDLVMALKCYLVVEGIKGGEGIRLWFRQRAGVLVVVGILYLLFAAGMIFLELIPAGALHPTQKGFMGSVFLLLELLAPYLNAFIVLLLIVVGFVVDLVLAVKSYKGMDDLHGRDALLGWLRQRTGLMVMTGALYLIYVIVVYTDLLYLAGFRQAAVAVAKVIVSILTGMNPVLSALGVLSFIVAGFTMDLCLALYSYRGLDNLQGREALLSWFRHRCWRLVTAGVLYLLFVIVFFSDLFNLSAFRKEFISLAQDAFSFLVVVGPYKSAIFLLILILAGAVVDISVALKASRGLDNLQSREVVREWFKLRTWRLAGMGFFFLTYVYLVVFTDLITLPGARYDNKEYVDNAKEFLHQGKYREGALELRNALQKNPDDRVARLVLARTLLAMKDYLGAEKEFRTVDAVDATLYETKYGLARVSLVKGRKEEALVELREAIRRKPTAFEPHLLLAKIYSGEKKFSQAVQECRLVLNLDLGHRQAREQLIVAALAGRIYDEAAREAEVGRRSDPVDMKMWFYQAEALQHLGRADEAERVLREAAAANPALGTPLFRLGDDFARRGVIPSAVRCYEEGLKREPQNLPVMNNLAQLLADQGSDLRRAQELAAYVNWKQPGNPAYADTLGWVLVKRNKFDEAVPYLMSATKRAPQIPGIHYHLGVALIKSGNRDAGRGQLSTALRLAKDFDGAAQARALLAKP